MLDTPTPYTSNTFCLDTTPKKGNSAALVMVLLPALPRPLHSEDKVKLAGDSPCRWGCLKIQLRCAKSSVKKHFRLLQQYNSSIQ